MKYLLTVLLASLLTTTWVPAGDPPPPPPQDEAQADQQPTDRPFAGPDRGKGPRHGGMHRGFSSRMLERVKDEDPEEYERLKTLYQTDRRAFFQAVREYFKDKGWDSPEPVRAQEQKVNELAKAYHETDDPQRRQQLKGEIETALGEAFDARMKAQLERLEQIERGLVQMRTKLEKRQKAREEIVQDRLDQLLQSPPPRPPEQPPQPPQP